MADDQTIDPGAEEADGAVVQPPVPAPEDGDVAPLPVVEGEDNGDDAVVAPAPEEEEEPTA